MVNEIHPFALQTLGGYLFLPLYQRTPPLAPVSRCSFPAAGAMGTRTGPTGTGLVWISPHLLGCDSWTAQTLQINDPNRSRQAGEQQSQGKQVSLLLIIIYLLPPHTPT